jgi:hypothetical protein
MDMENNIDVFIEQIENNKDDELRKCIEEWFEKTRNQSMRLGATYIAAAVYGAIEKNLKNGMNSSLRDFQRAIKRVVEIISVQLNQEETQQNDLSEDTSEEVAND